MKSSAAPISIVDNNKKLRHAIVHIVAANKQLLGLFGHMYVDSYKKSVIGHTCIFFKRKKMSCRYSMLAMMKSWCLLLLKQSSEAGGGMEHGRLSQAL